MGCVTQIENVAKYQFRPLYYESILDNSTISWSTITREITKEALQKQCTNKKDIQKPAEFAYFFHPLIFTNKTKYKTKLIMESKKYAKN